MHSTFNIACIHPYINFNTFYTFKSVCVFHVCTFYMFIVHSLAAVFLFSTYLRWMNNINGSLGKWIKVKSVLSKQVRVIVILISIVRHKAFYKHSIHEKKTRFTLHAGLTMMMMMMTIAVVMWWWSWEEEEDDRIFFGEFYRKVAGNAHKA